MIKQALKQDIKIVLMTPTPDLTENILDENTPLAKHARQIRDLASKYHLGWSIVMLCSKIWLRKGKIFGNT